MARKKRFAPNDNNLAIAYYRFSSHSQNDASIDQQRDLAHEWAYAHGFKIVQEYEDAAISGTTDARPGFQQMLSEVAKIRPHTLIMWKTDRLGRDKYVLAMAKKKIRDAGCEIHLLAENIPTEGPEGVLIEGLMEAMAEYYSRQLSQNIQRGMDYNAQHALVQRPQAVRLYVDRSTKKYIPDPNTAPFVQWAFREYASGKPLKTIAEEMNAQGRRTPRNAKFSVNMLNKMLENRAYIGEYHHGDIVVEGGMPVLVDKATFDRAQRRFTENKRKGSQRIRDQVFEYLVDKVYLYDDKLVVSMWFSEDDKQEITWRDWFSLDEYWTDESPFVKGGSVEFDRFPLSSTKAAQIRTAGVFHQRNVRVGV